MPSPHVTTDWILTHPGDAPFADASLVGTADSGGGSHAASPFRGRATPPEPDPAHVSLHDGTALAGFYEQGAAP